MTQQHLQTFISYDPNTGKVHWKIATGSTSVGKEASNTTSDNRYHRVTIQGTEYLTHRLIFLYMTGSFPEYVDHINGDSLDNRWSNLRSVTHQENICNRRKMKSNTSGTTGVTWDKSRDAWKVTLAGKHLGRFTNLEDATACREAAVKANKTYTSRHGK